MKATPLALSTVGAIALVATGCLPPPPVAPGPIALTTTRPVDQVVSAASRVLTTAGFDIAAVDVAGGVLTAKKEGRANDIRGEFVTCRFARGSIADASTVTLTISVSAIKSPTGTDIRIQSRANTDYRSTALPSVGASATDCVTSGRTETEVAQAVR